MKEKSLKTEVSREVRLAVVMYGGVSLAIYINGVSQELFSLVRATAQRENGTPLVGNEDLRGAEGVYRQLGQLLGSEKEKRLKECDREAQLGVWDPESPPEEPIRTRFIIDVLSGTSAGGINAVFLAKALANGQDVAKLEQLWVDEGAIEQLINDKGATKDSALQPQKPPRSLLSGQRMYYKLVEAFDGMEEERIDTSGGKRGAPSTEGTKSPYVEELDLFVTATDLDGVPVPLRLSDKLVYERRHRNVFHFAYAGGEARKAQNDFHASNNAFLAFAARCTSAFPFAFEPMCLNDVDVVLEATDRPWHQSAAGTRWESFFPAYRDAEGRPLNFAARAFADGGYLDNKPFGYAIDALATRSARVAVDRKLIYIEPNPRPLNPNARASPPPNAIENVAAAFALARYETIREDLLRVLARNRLIGRVRTLMLGLEEDVVLGGFDTQGHDSEFGKRYLDDMVKLPGVGVAYGGYHRLRVATVSDEMARVVARAFEFEDQSDHFLAIRYLVSAWRNCHFARYRKDGAKGRPGHPENLFLLKYDLAYRLRRLNFVLFKIDQLRRLDEVTEAILEHKPFPASSSTGKGGAESPAKPLPEGEDAARFTGELMRLRSELRKPFIELHRASERLQKTGEENPLQRGVVKLKEAGITERELEQILERPTEAQRKAFAVEAYKENAGAFDALAGALDEFLREVLLKASQTCKEVLKQEPAPTEEPWAATARELVRDYYTSHGYYDLVTFSVLKTADLGQEIDDVEVVRISPDDARSLREDATSKLAGTALMNFGAFLDASWRRNDILWGRLDGAERIISALLPEGELRKAFIEKAHRELLAEGFSLGGGLDEDGKDAAAGMTKALVRQEAGADLQEALERDVHRARAPELYKDALYKRFRSDFKVTRRPDPQLAVQAMARSTRVVGQMFEQIADAYHVSGKPGAWVAKLGAIFWGLVEVAVPNSLKYLIFAHWLKVLYMFEVLLIVTGTVLVQEDVSLAGWIALVVTVVVHVLTWFLGQRMTGQKRLGKALKIFLSGAAAGITVGLVLVLLVKGGQAALEQFGLLP